MIYKTRTFLRTDLCHSWQGFSKLTFTKWCSFLRLALPNFLMISEWWASEITVLLAGLLPRPHLSLSALALMTSTTSICFMPPLSLGIAVNIRVSNELGAGRPMLAKRAACAACVAGLVIITTSSLLLLICRRWWALLFTSDAAVLDHVMPVLSVCSFYVVFDGLASVISGSLKGCGRHAVLAPIIVVAYYIVGLPLSWLLAWPRHLDTLGLAWGSAIGTFTHCALFAVLLATTSWPLMCQRAQARLQAKPLLPETTPDADAA